MLTEKKKESCSHFLEERIEKHCHYNKQFIYVFAAVLYARPMRKCTMNKKVKWREEKRDKKRWELRYINVILMKNAMRAVKDKQNK